jgi:hypothetical protein
MRVCLDFDGVIHSYTSPWSGPTVISDGIVPGAAAFIIDCQTAGLTVAIHSSRSHSESGIEAMKDWLVRAICEELAGSDQLKQAERIVADIEFPEHKPPAQIYIDDRGYHFRGRFPTIDKIRTFKPWNK